MYSTCLFCNQALGGNAVIEAFPVGRRIAFDTARGRLWVVCRKCERWNLSPIEERWEAVESCERLFRETRLRTSTENIGLARLHEGLELVRIGQALRPEFAAWRYGDQFGRRRRKFFLYGAGGALAVIALGVGGLAVGVISSSILAQSGNFVNIWMNGRTLLKLRTEDGAVIKLKNPDLQTTAIVPPRESDEWRVLIGKDKKQRTFVGPEAERLAGLVLPKLNRAGGARTTVQEAVRQIETTGGVEGFLRSDLLDPRVTGAAVASKRGRRAVRVRGPDGEPVLQVAKLPTPTRLAIEMALHEEQERRALQGELKALEIAWREAERIAAIADDLLLPAGTEGFIERHRTEPAERGGRGA